MNSELFDKLRELSGLFSDKFNVIDEPIDMKLQMAYFKRSKKIKSSPAAENIDLEKIGNLHNPDLDAEQIKDNMILLSSVDDPKAYRILEEFSKDTENPLHQWALMALQESKMLIEGNLLDERQIFVSTGLGGHGNLLRYFVALIGNNIEEFMPYQQHVVQSEFETALKNNRSELERIEFQDKYAALTVLMPLNVPFHQILLDAVEECNQYGDFLQSDFLVTNVKMLSFDEIRDIVRKKQLDIDDYGIETDSIDEITGGEDENAE